MKSNSPLPQISKAAEVISRAEREIGKAFKELTLDLGLGDYGSEFEEMTRGRDRKNNSLKAWEKALSEALELLQIEGDMDELKCRLRSLKSGDSNGSVDRIEKRISAL